MKKIQCFIGIIVLCVSAYVVAQPIAPNAGEIYKLDFEWGSRGSEDGQFGNRGVLLLMRQDMSMLRIWIITGCKSLLHLVNL